MFKRFVWWLPSVIHDLLVRITGWRVVHVVDDLGDTSLVWSPDYPIPVTWELDELAWEEFVRKPQKVQVAQWWGEQIEGYEYAAFWDQTQLMIPTRSGRMVARPGDWLVCFDGQMWVCEEELFDRLYNDPRGEEMIDGDG